MDSGTPEQERVGLLFVHGIGEQKRFDHLRASVTEFAELMKQSGEDGEKFACTILDRTPDWKIEPGGTHPQGLTPVTLTLVSDRRNLVFDCHEVWWADLGARTGIADSLGFWLWGLGQWCAPIYRELDAADLEKTKTDREGKAFNKNASKLVRLPDAVAGRFGAECLARARLAMASFSTIFVAVSWMILKRLFSAALQQTPSPTLLVSYVGDVRTYEERASPGATELSDPGHPRRVAIRRRMVRELVGMGARQDLDRWYIVAHSLGTVLGYNGITEIGHTLPNYLSEEAWRGLPEHLKRDQGCDKRPPSEIPDMMPARPAWLEYEDLVNRPELFARLRGFLTYGSPLNKFAAIWPRIVATATDRKPRAKRSFPNSCRWVNLRALQDPVSGDVRRFFAGRPDRPGFSEQIPDIVNVDLPFRPNYLLAHLRYFSVAERFSRRMAVDQRIALMRWIMTRDTEAANEAVEKIEQAGYPGREHIVSASYLLVLALLALAAICSLTLGGDLLMALFGSGKTVSYRNLGDFAFHAWKNTVPLLAVASALLVSSGYFRWIRECSLNRRLALNDYLPRVARLLAIQIGGATAAIASTLAFIVYLYGWPKTIELPPAILVLELSAWLAALGLLTQAMINWLFGTPLRYAAVDRH